MRTHVKHVTSLFRRLKKAETGVAAVEFALIVPMLLLLYLGAVDLTQGLMADRKLTHLAGTLSDLVARQAAETVSTSDIEEYFSASTALMRPYDATSTGMRVSIATVDSDGSAEVVASAAAHGVTALSTGDAVDIPSEVAALAADRCVVIGESWYAYSPMFRYVFQADVPLYQRAINIPRMESEDCESAALSVCAGLSGNAVVGMNCNNPNNSWGTGNGQGGGLSNSGGSGNSSGGNAGGNSGGSASSASSTSSDDSASETSSGSTTGDSSGDSDDGSDGGSDGGWDWSSWDWGWSWSWWG